MDAELYYTSDTKPSTLTWLVTLQIADKLNLLMK